jgi:hypothetical protein
MTDMPGDGRPEPMISAPVQMYSTCASTICHGGAALTHDPRFDAQPQREVR